MHLIYKNTSTDGYYIYAYLRENDLTPYYIGKGRGDRAYDKSSHSIKAPKNKCLIIILESGLTELGAFALERRLIQWWGRKDNGTGILRNRTDGGEGASGVVQSLEHRKKNSESQKKRPPASKETRDKLSNANKGKKRSEEFVVNNKLSKIGKIWWNDGANNKYCKESPGEGWVKGKFTSTKNREIISERNKKRTVSEDTKNKHKTNQKEFGWWTNGKVAVRVKACPGLEWKRGRKILSN